MINNQLDTKEAGSSARLGTRENWLPHLLPLGAIHPLWMQHARCSTQRPGLLKKSLHFSEHPDRLQLTSQLQRPQVKPARTSGRCGYHFTTVLGSRVSLGVAVKLRGLAHYLSSGSFSWVPTQAVVRTERVNVCKLLRTEPNTEQVCRSRAPAPGQQGFWPENSGSEGGDHTGLSSNGVFLDDRSVFYSDGATLGGLDRGGSPERSRHDEIKPRLQLSAPLPILWRGVAGK